MIHKTAIIGENVKLGSGIEIGPYTIVEDHVQLGDACRLASHVIVRSGSQLGKDVSVDSFAVIGGSPQDTSFDLKTRSGVIVGEGTTIREGVTIHRAVTEGEYTRVGKNCFLMANCHIAHDCVIGDEVKMANGALLGGYVKIEDYVFIGGNAVLHQNIRIGEGTIIAGCGRLNLDIPPFLIVSELTEVNGFNVIGIKRRGFGQAEISDVKVCFSAVLGTPGNPYIKAQAAREQGLAKTALGKTFLAFFEKKGKKGCVHERHIMGLSHG